MSDTSLKSSSDILRLYIGIIDRFFGMYLDACGGFQFYAERFATLVPHEGRLNQIFMGDFNDPNDANATYNHSEVIQHVIDRNQRNGENQLLLAHSLIVFIYSIWDTEIRPAYSKSLSVKQHDVMSDAMGDLRLYRNAIVHSNLKLQSSTKKFIFISVGNAIVLTGEQIREMLALIFDDLTQMHEKLTGEKVALRFERRLNAPK